MKKLSLLVLLFGLALPVPQTAAQTYPTMPVRLIIPYPPGGPMDDVGRVVGQRLSEMWGQPVVVDNRSGADGSIGTEFVIQARPDGYTLLLGNSGPISINPNLHKGSKHNPLKDLEPITMLITMPQVLLVNPNLPVHSIKELVEFAGSRPPGTLNYASSGVGNIQHLAMEELRAVAGIRMNHIPYRGTAPAYIDLLAGRVELMFGNTVGSLNFITAGSVRPIAISSMRRLPLLPNVPTIAESYPGFEVTSWVGLFAPKDVPQPIIHKIQTDAAKVMAMPDVQARFAAQGAEVVASTPEQLRDFTLKEEAIYARIIQSTGLAPK